MLLVVLDTVRADRLSLYGYGRDTTPNLARLAERGVVFNEARSAAPWTLPSHASLFTGRWPHELNVSGDRPLDGTFPTLAEFLAKHGYATAGFVGNTYFCNSWYGLNRGFFHYEDYYEQNIIISPGEALRCYGAGSLADPPGRDRLQRSSRNGQHPQECGAGQPRFPRLARGRIGGNGRSSPSSTTSTLTTPT